ncbi:hypothetical protein Tco_0775290 [Tanacetum coccineum]
MSIQRSGCVVYFNALLECNYGVIGDKLSKRRTFWRLNEDILKITNTPYPSKKIWRIRAASPRPQKE